MTSLKWNQVNSWRLSRNHLLDRASSDQLLDVANRICGLHAQLMSAAELSLWARVEGISPADVKNAIWRKRQLVKTWAMRGTLHLISATEFPLYVAALSLHSHYHRESWLKYFGITRDDIGKIIEGVRSTLTDSGMTREQLAAAIAKRARKPKLAELLNSGWGSLLKPAAFQGHLCFGPSEGQKITFVRPDRWIGSWKEIDPQEALKEILRRFLSAYGPATTNDFARWWGLQPHAAKRLFKSLADEIEEVEVEGWRAWALASNIKDI
ncbi:MAG TPA: winged helix DNA-binding domain-containing protein, partial [Blastocatellia bacterium]